MSCNGSSTCTCGCCAGISVQTPQIITNPEAQPAISYRIGTWATFNESMLARLSSFDYPALAALMTRDSDDFTIAFLDATSIVLDILTFYEERLANESYLRTAVQLQSLTQLSRLIGYQPAPGVAAATYLAFTLKTTPGLPPDPSTPPIIIPAGTQTQSIPAQGQTPQTFETSAAIPAKPDWNALPVQTGQPWVPAAGDPGMYLAGTATQLNPGDLALIVGDERSSPGSSSTLWSPQFLTAVTPDTTNNRTWIAWATPLASATLTTEHPKIYAFRQRASLFGYNAIDPQMLDTTNTNIGNLLNGNQWANFQLSSTIDLDSSYSKVVTGSWALLLQSGVSDSGDTTVLREFELNLYHSGGGTTSPPAQNPQLYLATAVTPTSRTDFGLSAKITRVTPDITSELSAFDLRTTAAFVQTDLLTPAEEPLDHPLYGTLLDLEVLRPDLVGATVVALFGVAQKISVNAGVSTLEFVPDDPTAPTVVLNPGDIFTLIQPPPLPFNPDGSIPSWTQSTAPLTLKVSDSSGRTGTLQGQTVTRVFFAEEKLLKFGGGGHGPVISETTTYPLSLSQFSLVSSSTTDPEIAECALVSQVVAVTTPFPHTQIQLQNPLLNCYNRAATTVNVNVAAATAGASVTEIMGNGSASTPDQSFTLRQSPLTYIQAPTPTGRQSTLTVRANGVAWTQVPTLYEQPSSAQDYVIENQSDGTSDVIFGDGVEGATLPTGQNNIIANYRIGSGSAGNVAAGAITTLMQRPLGVSSVTNPEAATGGTDPQSIDDVRANAPQTVLTLGRAVSITDYQNFASTFAGIEQAYAIWIPSGPARGVFVTVAATGGVALEPGDITITNLQTALQNYGNPLIPISIGSFIESLFGFTADVAYNPAYSQPVVQAQIMQTLTQTFSFANRSFGQGISTDEIAAVIQNVPGVVAVNVSNPTVTYSSKGGDLANLAGGFTVSNWTNWISQQVSVPRPYSDSASRICPYIPVPNGQSLPLPAEILVIDPDPTSIILGVMS